MLGIMRSMTVRLAHTCCLAAATAAATSAAAVPFEDHTAALIGATAQWSHKVELADLDADGRIDIVIANGGDYNGPGAPELSFVFMQNADGTFTDKGATVFGEPGLTRAIKARDLDGDGDQDLLVAGAWGTPSRLLLNDGSAQFDDATDRLPAEPAISAGDVELGDADGDGDLDALVMDFGDGDPFEVKGRPRVWINDGAARFSDETDARFPTTKTGFSWDGEWGDVDDDGDLDALVSCKVCSDGGIYLENQGDGTFLDRSGLLPGDGNNYEFELMDIDGDGDLDVATINDGPELRERILRNELNGEGESGVFVDASAELLEGGANIGEDDNAALFFDIDSDGDADLLIGSLSGPDRLLKNDGGGVFNLAGEITDDFTSGTLGMAVGDLDGDGRGDLVMCQGEQDVAEKIYLAGDEVAPDAQPPVIGTPRVLAGGDVLVRIHDNKTPVKDHDFANVFLSTRDGDVPLRWVGEALWRATPPEGASRFVACAADAAGNSACGPAIGEEPDPQPVGCAFAAPAAPTSPMPADLGPDVLALLLAPLAMLRTKRTRRKTKVQR